MYKRIIVKIGSGVISDNGHLKEDVVMNIVRQIADVRGKGVETILVTSGAVAAGKGTLGKDGDSVLERQVFAAVGQIGLMSLYQRLFKEHALDCAQVLVTKGDFRDKEHYANMKNCFENLLAQGIVPVVNENDTVAIQELQFSDNDELAALIGAQLNAEAVLFLSTVDGVLVEDAAVSEVDSENFASFEGHVTSKKSASGRGGMETKFKLAKKLMSQGIVAYIANGARENVILDITEGKAVGTKFIPKGKLSAVKRRLAYTDGLSKGVAYVNQGAKDILTSGKSSSLLPVGITKIEGSFKKGDTIEIHDESGKKIGSGVAQYGAEEAQTNVGKKGAKELVHYDSMFIG